MKNIHDDDYSRLGSILALEAKGTVSRWETYSWQPARLTAKKLAQNDGTCDGSDGNNSCPVQERQ